MTETATTETGVGTGREAVRMYPNNSLKKTEGEVRNLAFEMIRETFKK